MMMGILKFKQSYKVQSLFLNAYYDIHTGTKVTPYIGVGIGTVFIRTKERMNTVIGSSGDTGSRKVTNFAWNIGLGLGYQITDNVALDISYRFADLGKVKTGMGFEPILPVMWQTNTKRLYQHQFGVGARISF